MILIITTIITNKDSTRTWDERSIDDIISTDHVFLLVSLIGRTYLWGTSRGGE